MNKIVKLLLLLIATSTAQAQEQIPDKKLGEALDRAIFSNTGNFVAVSGILKFAYFDSAEKKFALGYFLDIENTDTVEFYYCEKKRAAETVKRNQIKETKESCKSAPGSGGDEIGRNALLWVYSDQAKSYEISSASTGEKLRTILCADAPANILSAAKSASVGSSGLAGNEANIKLLTGSKEFIGATVLPAESKNQNIAQDCAQANNFITFPLIATMEKTGINVFGVNNYDSRIINPFDR